MPQLPHNAPLCHPEDWLFKEAGGSFWRAKSGLTALDLAFESSSQASWKLLILNVLSHLGRRKATEGGRGWGVGRAGPLQ